MFSIALKSLRYNCSIADSILPGTQPSLNYDTVYSVYRKPWTFGMFGQWHDDFRSVQVRSWIWSFV